MATITDTAGTDSLTGTSSNDTINGLGGNDTVRGLGGNDTIRGGDGNDSLLGGNNNDFIYGEAGDDIVLGEAGGDLLLDGGLGNDSVSGGDGDDTLFVRVGEGQDTLDGGIGIDALTIEVASAQLTAAIRADFETLWSWISNPTPPTLTLTALGLTLTGIESLNILLDGQAVDIAALRNSAPVADGNSVMTSEDETVSGQLIASDPEGGAVTWALLEAPQYGTLQLDAEGNYTYEAQANFSGSDGFLVRVADAAGLTTDQWIDVLIAPVTDMPTVVTGAASVDLAVVLDGTAADETLSGGMSNDTIDGGAGNDLIIGDDASDVRRIALDVTASLGDQDSSETMTVRISGMPDDASLSAGTQNTDGSWSLEPGELTDLALLTSRTDDFTVQVEISATESGAQGDVVTAVAVIPVSFVKGAGSDVLSGGTGDDTIHGGHGSDEIDAGSGADVVDGGDGNDAIRVVAGDGHDVVAGGAGADTLVLEISGSQLTSGVRNDLRALDTWMGQQAEGADASGDALALASLGLTVSMIEQIVVRVDGVETDIASLFASPPQADPLVSEAISEDGVLSGQLEATDADGDVLSWSILAGPGHGTLSLEASGQYTYTAAAGYSGADSFTVRVADTSGSFAEQVVEIAIAAVADAPTLQVSAATSGAAAAAVSMVGTDAGDTLTGTSGADLIEPGAGDDLVRGDSAGSSGSVAIDIVASLNDPDGSETLSVRISGVPADASLSAGVENTDGSWSLSAADLAGLTLSAPAGSYMLSVSATATEATGQTATVTAPLSVTVAGGAAGAGNDTIHGMGGNDTIYGGGGDDLVRGGWGDDVLHDEAGNDHVRGGKGNDVIHNGAGNDLVWAGKANDIIHDGAGNDDIHGDKGNDLIVAGAGSNRYHGGEGFDTLDLSGLGAAVAVNFGEHTVTGASVSRIDRIEKVIGTAHADTFVGGQGWNFIDAGAGNDTIRGGRGDDRLAGDDGNDTFIWLKDDVRGYTDTILDFAAGDRLDLKALLKGVSYGSTNSVVRVSDNAWGTSVSVKVDGKLTEIAKLEGFHATSAASMLAADMILV